MNEYEVYVEYTALKQHFYSPNYDYFKYNKKTRTSPSAYLKRKDRQFFQWLANHKDPVGFLLSNLIIRKMYIRDLSPHNEEARANYLRWQRVNQSLSYTFDRELSQFQSLKHAVDARKGLPPILQFFFAGKVSIETITILIEITKCDQHWNDHLKDDPLWEELYPKLKKYLPFVKYNRKKLLETVRKCLTPVMEEV